MCRLYGFRANAQTTVECTLVRAQNSLLSQSRVDMRGASSPDGWGIAWYQNGAPTIERQQTAAFGDQRFSATAEGVASRTVIAHVRRATLGGAALANTHPFSQGLWTFAHNGTLTAFDRVGSLLENETDPLFLSGRQGTTDSELIFLWLLSRMAKLGIDPQRRCDDTEGLVEMVADSVLSLASLSEELGATESAQLNLLLTDGELLIASRWKNSLYWVDRQGVHDSEVCGLSHVPQATDSDYRAVVVASEPISRESWREVPARSILRVDRDVHAEIRSI